MKISKISSKLNGKTYTRYRVYCGTDGNGKKIFKYTVSLEKAKAYLKVYTKAQSNFDKRWVGLSDSVKHEIFEILKYCAKHNTNLTDITNFYHKHKSLETGKLLKDCVAEFMQSMVDNKRRKSYIATMRQWTTQIVQIYGNMPMPSITAKMLDEACKLKSIRSRPTWRKNAVTLWSYGIKNVYVTENVAEKIEMPYIERDVPYVLSVAQITTLLKTCPLSCLSGLVLMLFGGIRPAESKQIRWEDVNFQRKTVTIDASIAKTRSYRLVPMSDNMAEWMCYCKMKKQKLPYTHSTKTLTSEFAKCLHVSNWWRDCLRHTSASMMLARDKSADKVALDLGNSPTILHRHYKNLVSEEDMKAFWAITPNIRETIY